MPLLTEDVQVSITRKVTLAKQLLNHKQKQQLTAGTLKLVPDKIKQRGTLAWRTKPMTRESSLTDDDCTPWRPVSAITMRLAGDSRRLICSNAKCRTETNSKDKAIDKRLRVEEPYLQEVQTKAVEQISALHTLRHTSSRLSNSHERNL